MRTACFVALAAVAVLVMADPAQAQTMTAVTALITEWRTWVITVLGGFALLIGLVVAWVVAWRNLLAGAVIGLAVLALGAVVGNYQTIATVLGLG